MSIVLKWQASDYIQVISNGCKSMKYLIILNSHNFFLNTRALSLDLCKAFSSWLFYNVNKVHK